MNYFIYICNMIEDLIIGFLKGVKAAFWVFVIILLIVIVFYL